MSSYTASPEQYTNTGRRVVLVSLYGLSYLTVTCSLFPWFDSGYNLRQSTLASVGTETGTRQTSGKYSGIFVFTAPVAELTVVSFTVPLNGWTIDATATVVISCSLSADMCCGSVCVAMSCGGGFFTPGGAYDSVWDSVRPMTGKCLIKPRGRWLCMHAEFLDQQQ